MMFALSKGFIDKIWNSLPINIKMSENSKVATYEHLNVLKNLI